jgi:hypothetical protein
MVQPDDDLPGGYYPAFAWIKPPLFRRRTGAWCSRLRKTIRLALPALEQLWRRYWYPIYAFVRLLRLMWEALE